MKINLTVGKKFTLNTQNFSSVSPTVTLEVVDGVELDDVLKVHELLEIIADGLLHKQIESDALTMAHIKKLGFSEYFKKVREESNMDDVMEQAIRKLTEIPPF